MFYGLSDFAMIHHAYVVRCGLVLVGGYIAFSIIARSNED
jgi:hypothetical protein